MPVQDHESIFSPSRNRLQEEAAAFADLYGKTPLSPEDHDKVGERMHLLRDYLDEIGDIGDAAGPGLKDFYIAVVEELAAASQTFLDHLDHQEGQEKEKSSEIPVAQTTETSASSSPSEEVVTKGLKDMPPAPPAHQEMTEKEESEDTTEEKQEKKDAKISETPSENKETAESDPYADAFDAHLETLVKLEKERNAIHGLFTGKKKKELDEQIENEKNAINANGRVLVSKEQADADKIRTYIKEKKAEIEQNMAS